MASKYLQKFPVPENFYEVLHDFAREVIRDQPEDIIEYAANYFEAKEQGKPFIYDGKYNIKRSDQTIHREYHPENQRKHGQEAEIQSKKQTEPSQTKKPPSQEQTKRIPSQEKKERKSKEAEHERPASHEGERLQTGTSHGTEKAAAHDYVNNLINRSLQSDQLNYNDIEDENIQEKEISSDTVSGEFYVQVLNASNLAVEDAQTETYCIVFFSNKPTKIIKTANSADARNPQWNHLDKFVFQIDRSELFDLKLVVQIFNSEIVQKTLVGENLYDPIEIFENPSEKQPIKLKLKNSEGEDGEFGEINLLVSWVPEGNPIPEFN